MVKSCLGSLAHTEHADSLSVGLEPINPILATSTNAVTAPDHITVSPSQEY